MAAGAATWATATVAGCQDGATPTDTEPPTEEDTPTDTPEPQPANYVVTDEMATAGAFGVSFASSCSPTRLFAPGMKAVWEINVYDAETGDNLADDVIDAVTINIDNNGATLEAEWIGDAEEHPAPIWDASWDIPTDAETGEWTYTIEVEATDADVKTVGRATGSFTVMEDEMPDFYVSTETYWNGAPDDLPEGTNGFVGTCAPEREFFPDMDPTFYVQIYETETGLLVGAPPAEDEETPTPVQEGETVLGKISDTTVEGVTVSFPDLSWDDIALEWYSGIGDSHTVPHWEATLTEPETLPTGGHAWEVTIEGVDETDMEIVGAASDVFNVIEKPE